MQQQFITGWTEDGYKKEQVELFRQLDTEECKHLSQCIMMSLDPVDKNDFDPNERGIDDFLPLQIILKRIEAFDLPIKFTQSGLAASIIWATTPGRGMAFLIDCLKSDTKLSLWKELKENGKKFKEEDKLSLDACYISEKVYPWGVMTDDNLCYYIDTYLKPRKDNWFFLY